MSETGKPTPKLVNLTDTEGNPVAVNPSNIAMIVASPVKGKTDIHTTGGVKHTIDAAITDVIKLIEDGLAIWADLGL